jgi:hypothetical protein
MGCVGELVDISVMLSGIAMGAGFGFVLHLISTLAMSSVVSMASIFVGSWSMFYLLFMKKSAGR